MMAIEVSKLKITHNIFEYYILHINSINNISLLEDKLTSFNKSINTLENLIIKFDDSILMEDVEKIASKIIDICEEYKINIYAFDISHVYGINTLFGIDIINLPINTVKQNIFMGETLIIDEPIRSGAKIFNNGDVIVTSFVSHGAEVIATGNIHIYGELKGKAIAGVEGDNKCKIFIQRFNPELVSIAGYYKVFDEKLVDDLYNHSVLVELDKNNRINIKKIT
jgi:septum site-determining protein MinC